MYKNTHKNQYGDDLIMSWEQVADLKLQVCEEQGAFQHGATTKLPSDVPYSDFIGHNSRDGKKEKFVPADKTRD